MAIEDVNMTEVRVENAEFVISDNIVSTFCHFDIHFLVVEIVEF